MTQPQEAQTDLRSQHTANFAEILAQLNISLVVSTYQAGKLILLRAKQGIVNTHFKSFQRPMGMACKDGQFSLGSHHQILTFRNVPQVAAQLNSDILHDACYLPAHSHITGDIDIHEMAYVEDELWIVNTQFSCLCTLDPANSFVPQWRPPFISAYALGDRCHLNGLAVRDAEVRYVTALGQTDHKGGWRANKAKGGLLMEIQSNEIILDGLSMPHSPRWYRDTLWFLESGYGSLSQVNLEQKTTQMVAQMPGFTRGCAFYDDFAFVGLSKVRESATFSGLPLTKTQEERICGVWVIHLPTANIVAFLKFQGDVEEIFAVEVLPNCRHPEITEWDSEQALHAYVLPDLAFSEVDDTPLEPSVGMKLFEWGNDLYQKGQLDAAIASYQACLEQEPNNLLARFNLGVALGDNGLLVEALAELHQIIQEDAAHAEAHNSLAYVYVRLKNFPKAIEHYEKAIKINPKYDSARQNLDKVRQCLNAPE